jgi:uncharacterized alkaline shock family protein YloU
MSQQGLVLDGPLGRVELTGAALAALVARSAEAVPGVHLRRPRRGLRVSVEESSVHVELRLATALGSVLPDVGSEVQRSVVGAVGVATGLPTSVDVTVEELV